MYKKFSLLLFISCFSGQFLQPQVQPAESTVPSLKELKQNIAHCVLENGMRVVAYKDSRNPKVHLQIAYNIGSAVENDQEKGLAHLVRHMLFEGCKSNLCEGGVEAIVKNYGLIFNAFVSQDVTNYFFDVDKAGWQPLLYIFAGYMQDADFDAEHLASQIPVVVQQLKMREVRHNYGLSAFEKGFSLVFAKGHPYHDPIGGDVSQLANYTSEDVKRFYQKHYHLGNAVFFIAGDIDLEQALKKVKDAFASVKPGKENINEKLVFPEPELRENKTTESEAQLFRPVEEPKLHFFWQVPGLFDRQDSTRVVASTIFGGEKGLGYILDYRLYKRLVEQEKVATVAIASACLLQKDGFCFVVIVPEPGCEKQCEDILYEEINKVIQDGVSDFEIKKAVNKSIVAFFQMMETPQGIINSWVKDYLLTDDVFSVFQTPKKLLAVTPDAVQKFFAEFLQVQRVKKVSVLPVNAWFDQ